MWPIVVVATARGGNVLNFRAVKGILPAMSDGSNADPLREAPLSRFLVTLLSILTIFPSDKWL